MTKTRSLDIVRPVFKLGVSLVATLALLWSAPASAQCTGTVSHFAYNPFPNQIHAIAEKQLVTYQDDASTTALLPGPLSLGVFFPDMDSYHYTCGGSCFSVPTNVLNSNTFRAKWTITQGGLPVDAFLSDNGLTPEVTEATDVLIVPQLLNYSDSTFYDVLVEWTDYEIANATGHADMPGTVSFRVTIHRGPESDPIYTRIVKFMAVNSPPSTQPPPCSGGGACQVVPLSLSKNVPFQAPVVEIIGSPTGGMSIGSRRVIRGRASDEDRLEYYCALPLQSAPLTSLPIEDRLEFDWAVVNLPGDTGNGVFEDLEGATGQVIQHSSTIFRATSTGWVTIEFTAYDKQPGAKHEENDDTVRFYIHDVFLNKIGFGDDSPTTSGGGASHPIYSDGKQFLYESPHWQDYDGDGNAQGVGTDDNFPIAYTQGEKIVLDKISCVFKSGYTPPYVLVRADEALSNGDKTDHRQAWEAVLLDSPAPYPAPTAAERLGTKDGEEFISTVDLQSDIIGKFDLDLQWAVSFDSNDQKWEDINQSLSTLYVVLDTPDGLSAGFESVPSRGRWHSVYDISSRSVSETQLAAGGLTHADKELMVIESIWTQFEQAVGGAPLSRKAKDAFNNPDGASMTYYGGTLQGACVSVAAMLRGENNNEGNCNAFTDLLAACIQMQGIDAGERWILEPPEEEILTVSPTFPLGGGAVLPFSMQYILVHNFSETTWINDTAPFPDGAFPLIFDALANPGVPAPLPYFHLADALGVPGSGSTEPPPYFVRHIINGLKNPVTGTLMLLDPSYGLGTFALDILDAADQRAYQNMAIYGVGDEWAYQTPAGAWKSIYVHKTDPNVLNVDFFTDPKGPY